MREEQILQLKIISLAGVGSMSLDHEQVSLGQTISRKVLEAGKFTFLPAAASGGINRDTFLFKVSDGQTWSRVAYTMTVDTRPVEDLPPSPDDDGD